MIQVLLHGFLIKLAEAWLVCFEGVVGGRGASDKVVGGVERDCFTVLGGH
mgnify:CR=1 FL=1